METTTTDKVQVGESTTGTSTSTTYKVSSPPTEYGWVCPRCNRVNAPWKSQCDCLGGNWYPTWYPWDYKEPWWKQVYCDSDTFKVHPETTTWKAPSTFCTVDNSTNDPNKVTTAWNTIHNNMVHPDTITSVDSPWNQYYTLTEQLNKVQKEINNLKENK